MVTRISKTKNVSVHMLYGSFDSVIINESHYIKITHEFPFTVYIYHCVSNNHGYKHERTKLIYSSVEKFWYRIGKNLLKWEG